MKNHKVIGFTGTQQGMTEAQRITLDDIFKAEGKKIFEFHHGDCVGSDSEAHDIASLFSARIVVHPPRNPSRRAHRKGHIIHPTKPYLQRNYNIVDACDILIAMPSSYKERIRSGTWATIRYAQKQYKSIKIILPDGMIVSNSPLSILSILAYNLLYNPLY